MESMKLAVSLVVVLAIAAWGVSCVEVDVGREGDAPSGDEGDSEGRTFGILKKPLFLNGYDSVIETGLDGIGSLLGGSGGLGNLLNKIKKPFRPSRPVRPYQPYRPYRPYRPYNYQPYDYYASGYSPYYYDDYYYRDYYRNDDSGYYDGEYEK